MTSLASPNESCSVFVECSCVKCLLDDEQFSLTGFKVMHSSDLAGLISCSRLRYNGKLKLIYHNGDLKPLSAAVKTMDGERLLAALQDAVATALNVKNSGFLHCQNLLVGPDSLFVDGERGTAGLIYLPIFAPDTVSDDARFLQNMQSVADCVCESRPELAVGAMQALTKKLSDAPSLEELAAFLTTLTAPDTDGNQACIEISALNAPYELSFKVNRPEFILGKSVMGVDGTISFNSAISRVHCKISSADGRFFVHDLGSVNGTYVNHIRVAGTNAAPLCDGDVLTLANSDFAVKAIRHGGERG